LLDGILGLLPLEDWKNCRLVSRQWRDAGDRRLNQVKVNLKTRKDLEDLVMPSKSVQYMRSKERREIKFVHFDLPVDVPFGIELYNQFFRKVGEKVKSLTVRNNQWSISQLQAILVLHAPNLEELTIVGDVPLESDRRLMLHIPEGTKFVRMKKLTLTITNAHDKTPPGMNNIQGYTEGMVNPWTRNLLTDLFALSPNLEVIECSNKREMMANSASTIAVCKEVNRRPDEVIMSFVRVNQFITHRLLNRHHEIFPFLTTMNLYLRLNSRGMEKLRDKNYPLQSLDFHVKFYDKDSCLSLLRSLGKTLKHLRLRLDRTLIIDFDCSFLEKLETIHVEDYTGNLFFLNDIPNLKKVTLERIDGRRFVRKANLPTRVDSKVTDLVLENIRTNNSQGQLIKKMGVMFPNIQSLKVNAVKDSDIHRISDSMPQLKNLDVTSEQLTNLGMTGIDEVDMDRILLSGYELKKYNEYESLRKMPYIGDLKCNVQN
jgi:hypothetical protein